MKINAILLFISILPNGLSADELQINKVCPVSFPNSESLGILVLSDFWFHSGRDNASYIATDNATGIGVEIHFFSNHEGHLKTQNIAQCDKYRFLQVRETNSLLNAGELPVQIDTPAFFQQPFYDSSPLEFGYNTHFTPTDNSDKPWGARNTRASTVAIYDTPYVSDAYGVEGQHIQVNFETCVICQRKQGFDQLLSCATWGYQREYLNAETGWTEPDIIKPHCLLQASEQFKKTLEESAAIEYRYWLDWR